MPRPAMYTGIYVEDVPATAKIFEKALGAKVRKLQPDLVEVKLGKGRLLLNERPMQGLEATNPARNPDGSDIAGTELEFGIWVKDLVDVHRKIVDIMEDDADPSITYLSDIENKVSGIKEFRFKLPDGYYVRVTAELNKTVTA